MTMAGKILIGVGIFILFLFLVFAKVTINARSEYQEGDKFFRAKDYKQAIIHFNRAIHWYSPGSKSVTNSIRREGDVTYREYSRKPASVTPGSKQHG